MFCATGITKGDLVNGLELKDNKMVVNTLITHKSQKMKKIVIGEIDIKKWYLFPVKSGKNTKYPNV